MILELTEQDDVHADKVEEALRARMCSYFRLVTPRFPRAARATIRLEAGNKGGYLWSNGERIDLAAIKTVWYRRPAPPVEPPDLLPDDQRFVRRESHHVLKSLWLLLRDRFWVNPYFSSLAAEVKPYQLEAASEVGLQIPRTLITSDPLEALEFFGECGEKMIYKTFSPHLVQGSGGRGLAVFTNVIQRGDLVRWGEGIRLAPCLFQEWVPKISELRITVIGGEIFAAEILSQENPRARDDWRRANPRETPHVPYALPESIGSKIRALMERLGLVFGCLDFIVTPDKRYVFLEINQAGQWYWIEPLTGMPLLERFVAMLGRAEATRSHKRVSE